MDEILLPCNVCKEMLPEDNFYYSHKYPYKRNYRGYDCKACSLKRQKELRDDPNESKHRELFWDDLIELLTRLGYDVSDMENNPIHDQFKKRYEKELSIPVKTKKEKMREYHRLYSQKRRQDGRL